MEQTEKAVVAAQVVAILLAFAVAALIMYGCHPRPMDLTKLRTAELLPGRYAILLATPDVVVLKDSAGEPFRVALPAGCYDPKTAARAETLIVMQFEEHTIECVWSRVESPP